MNFPTPKEVMDRLMGKFELQICNSLKIASEFPIFIENIPKDIAELLSIQLNKKGWTTEILTNSESTTNLKITY